MNTLNAYLYAGLQTFHDKGTPPPYRFDRPNPGSLCETELRQICLDCIAYLCDFSKFAGTTAAAALQKVNDNETVLWISANQGFPRKGNPQQYQLEPHTNPRDIPTFIKGIIHEFREVRPENRMSLRAKFFETAILPARPRMETYRRHGLTNLNHVLESQEIQASSADSEDWKQKLLTLKGLMKDNQQLPQLAEWCYQNRRSWSDFIEREQLAQDNKPYWFRELKHYLYRLSAHAFAVDIIANAVQDVPSVRNISEVRFIPLSSEGFRYDDKEKPFKISTDGPMNVLDRLLTSLDTDLQTSRIRDALESENSRRKRMRDDLSQGQSASSPPPLDEWMEENSECRRWVHAETPSKTNSPWRL